MTLGQIKMAIAKGQKVYWSDYSYEVVKDNLSKYLIKCKANNHCIGLTWLDGVTMNGEESDFFTEEAILASMTPVACIKMGTTKWMDTYYIRKVDDSHFMMKLWNTDSEPTEEDISTGTAYHVGEFIGEFPTYYRAFALRVLGWLRNMNKLNGTYSYETEKWE
jgi:hypothetical protein